MGSVVSIYEYALKLQLLYNIGVVVMSNMRQSLQKMPRKLIDNGGVTFVF
jgi:hypothetical protein